ncbi:MAG: hypothetical protein ACR652_18310 [Methylocystis sp.]|uniref:hypothetical protein n=1 Tax=Methylocystis sp. TaxID=1911079 RepID=UPI003DA6891D
MRVVDLTTLTLMAYVTGGLAHGGAHISRAASHGLRPGLLLTANPPGLSSSVHVR